MVVEVVALVVIAAAILVFFLLVRHMTLVEEDERRTGIYGRARFNERMKQCKRGGHRAYRFYQCPCGKLTPDVIAARRLRPGKRGYYEMRTYHVKVTEDHIRRGVKGNVALCPFGLALESAGAAGVYFDVVELPQVVQDFIRDFDSGRTVRPFEVIIDDYRQPDPEPQRYRIGGFHEVAGRAARFEPAVASGRGRFEPVRR